MSNKQEQSYNTAKSEELQISPVSNWEDVKVENEENFILNDPLDIKYESKVEIEENVTLKVDEQRSESSNSLVEENLKFKYKCIFCKERFELENLLKDHVSLVHPKRKPFTCSLCGKQFRIHNTLRKHTNHHFGKVIYSCNTCSKQYNFKHSLKEHLLNFHTTKICDEEIDDLNSSDEENDAVNCMCKICHSDFTHLNDLKVHLDSHIEISLFNCEICNLYFETKARIVSHIFSHHASYNLENENSEKTSKTFSCNTCHSGFTKSSDLREHYLTHEYYKPYICDICGKAFKQAWKLTSHKVLHSGEKSHACGVCNKKFFYERNLKLHMTAHDEERSHICPVCGEKFKRKRNVSDHVDIHHSQNKKFECELCHKQFTTQTNLRNHLYQHIQASSTEIKFYCKVCGRRCRKKYDLNLHMASHSNERPHSCSICGKNYKTKANLKRHKSIHTEINSSTEINTKKSDAEQT